MKNQPTVASWMQRLALLASSHHAAKAELLAAVVAAVNSGEVSERQAAQATGLSRRTVRRWLGKDDWHTRPHKPQTKDN